ncbi:MAG: hypothetical protein IJ367_01800, partial [Clostridia bacterium]|nr:hypothetical protein [Clostridia bacterium]
MKKDSKKTKETANSKQKDTKRRETVEILRTIYSVPKVLISVVFLCIFSLSVFFYNPTLAIVQLVLSLTLFLVFLLTGNSSAKRFRKYIETLSFDVESASHNSVLKSPFPMAILREDGEIVWYNDAMANLSPGEDYIGHSLTDLIPEFQLPTQNSNTCEIQLEERYFTAYGVLADDSKSSDERVYIYYFIETTELQSMKQRYHEDMIVKGYIYVDNLD